MEGEVSERLRDLDIVLQRTNDYRRSTPSLSLSHTHTHPLSLAHTYTHTISLSLSHTHIRTHTHLDMVLQRTNDHRRSTPLHPQPQP